MKKYFYVLLLLFTVVTGFYFFYSWAQLPPDHRYIYPLDDVYIHLALARNFAELGVWSVNVSGFDSASSSILYTLLLSLLIRLFGDWEYYPLLINITFAYLTLYAVYRYFRDFSTKSAFIIAVVLLLPFTLLYVMALIGMEHTLHMFLIVTSLHTIQKNVRDGFRGKDFLLLLVLTFLLALVRFESMFFTAALAGALFLRKNFPQGLAVVAAGFLPILIFGFISVRMGGYFFPNSVMIKGSYPGGEHFLLSLWRLLADGILFNTSFYKCLFFPFVILSVHLYGKYRTKNWRTFFRNETALLVVVAVGLMQSLFAMLKYRYENYVMIAVLLLISPVLAATLEEIRKHDLWKRSTWILGFSGLMVVAVAGYRFGYHHKPLSYSSKGINAQQVEMSRFLHEEYRGEEVLANDIGAISYFSHVQLTDMVGLGSTDIARLKVNNKNGSRETYISANKKFITQYATDHGCRIAVIYPEWFPGGPPASWTPVASWRVRGAYGPAIERVVFYAVSPAEVPALRRKLQKFNRQKDIEQWFYIYK